MRLLGLLLGVLPMAVMAAEDGWRVLMHDADEPAIDLAHQRAATVLDQLSTDAFGRVDLPKARALLDAATRDAQYQELVGKWRCRSTQIDANGVFAYPAFRCEIELTEDGTLMFTKTSGSQRRHGQIYPFSDNRWVFMGGQSVNEDPLRSYSGLESRAADAQVDTVGLVETLQDGRIRIIFDAQDEQVEFYELQR